MGVSPPGPARAEKKNSCQKKSLAEKNSRAGKNSRAEKKKRRAKKTVVPKKKKVCQRKLTSSGVVKKKHGDTNWAPYWTVVISVMPKFSGKSSFLD